MEIPDQAQEYNNCFAAAVDRMESVSNWKQVAASLIEDPMLQASLRRMFAGLARKVTSQQDLLQESLLHLWKAEGARSRQTKSWYLQSCQFHVRHFPPPGRETPERPEPNNQIKPS